MKILIIEDQQELSDSVRDYLNHENFACEMAYDLLCGNGKGPSL